MNSKTKSQSDAIYRHVHSGMPIKQNKKNVELFKEHKPTKPLTIHRGMNENKKSGLGYESWSTRKHVARKFAGKTGSVITKTVRPHQVLVDIHRAAKNIGIKDPFIDKEREILLKHRP